MNTYRKKNYRKRSYSGRPHRRSADSYHQPLPPDQGRIPYARHTLTKPDVESVVEAMLSGTLTQGKELDRFESLLAKLTHSDYAIAMSSGTAAVHAALACQKLEPEDEVVTSTLNFCAVANMVTQIGAKPVLVDCDPDTLTISADAVKAAITDNTKAVFANNYAGHPSDLNALRELCEEHGLMLLEDACHGLGGKYRGHYVGNQADITCFSFHPSKAITTCEGGAVTTNNRAIAEWLRQFRHHGIQKDARFFTSTEEAPPFYQEVQFIGMNYRMSELHAAFGRSQLTRLDRHIERRRSIAQVYFQKLGSVEEIKLPYAADWADHAYHLFPVQFTGVLEDKRNEIFLGLKDAAIDAQFHYVPIHRMPFFAGLGRPESFPNAEAYYRQGLSLPLFPDLSYKELERITDALLKIVVKYTGSVKVETAASEAGSDSDQPSAAHGESDGEPNREPSSDIAAAAENDSAAEVAEGGAKPASAEAGDAEPPKRGGRGSRRTSRPRKTSKAVEKEGEEGGEKAPEKPKRRPRRPRSASTKSKNAAGTAEKEEKAPRRTRSSGARRSARSTSKTAEPKKAPAAPAESGPEGGEE